MRRLPWLLVVLTLAAAACSDDESRPADAPTTVATTAASDDGCPASTSAPVDSAAMLTLGPAAGIPATTAHGEPIVITGTVYDGGCAPVSGATLQVWQTDGAGVYGPGHGTDNLECCYLQGRVTTDANGRYGLVTVMPGHYQGEASPPPAHIHLEARHPTSGGLMAEIVFAGDPELTQPDADGYVVVTLSPTASTSEPRRGVADLELSTAT